MNKLFSITISFQCIRKVTGLEQTHIKILWPTGLCTEKPERKKSIIQSYCTNHLLVASAMPVCFHIRE